MATALITGASGGIGLELARIHASNKHNLVLVARSKKSLESIKKDFQAQYGVKVDVFDIDLSATDAPEKVYQFCKQNGIEINFLINNAGFGDFGFFVYADWSKQDQMMRLNMISLTHLCHLFVKDMVKRGSGKVMNVASTAAFQSGPTMAVYYATKAFVLNFSEALDNEVRDKCVTVTTLCPGPTESGFQAAAALEESKLVKGKKLPSAKEVAEYGYKAMMRGETVAIHGLMNRIMANSVRFLPRSVVVSVTRNMQSA